MLNSKLPSTFKQVPLQTYNDLNEEILYSLYKLITIVIYNISCVMYYASVAKNIFVI